MEHRSGLPRLIQTTPGDDSGLAGMFARVGLRIALIQDSWVYKRQVMELSCKSIGDQLRSLTLGQVWMSLALQPRVLGKGGQNRS